MLQKVDRSYHSLHMHSVRFQTHLIKLGFYHSSFVFFHVFQFPNVQWFLNLMCSCFTFLPRDQAVCTISSSLWGITTLHTNRERDVFLTYKLIIIPLISQRETPSQQSSPRTKYTIEPSLRSIEPSNKIHHLYDISSRLLSSNKVHHRASHEIYGALEQSPLNRGSTLFSGALE